MLVLTETMTAYELIRFLNGATGLGLPTQMGYNYVRKGMIPSVIVDGKVRVRREDAAAWMTKYLTKRNAK